MRDARGDLVLLIARTGVSTRGVKMTEGLCFTQGASCGEAACMQRSYQHIVLRPEFLAWEIIFLGQPGLGAGAGARKEGASLDKMICSRTMKTVKLEGVRGEVER